MNDKHRYAVILCGGSGLRLWPISRTLRPKQLLALNGKDSLLQQTAFRLTKLVSNDNLFIVTHEDHKFEVRDQLAEKYGSSIQNILAEPFAKNTLPAIAWSTYQIYKKDKDAVVGVFPADHAIDNEQAFLKAWQVAEETALKDYLILLGVKPNMLATGYGYIRPGEFLESITDTSAFEVDGFVEKPDISKAEQFIKDGYLWNSGIFVFKTKIFMDMLQDYQPEIYKSLIKLSSNNLNDIYTNFPNLSMDYGLVEKADNIAVIPVEMGWSDLGTWDSIYTKHKKDQNNNVCHGEVLNLDTKNSLIWSESGLLATLGLDNIVAIQTADATLVFDRRRSEDIKSLVSKVKAHNLLLTDIHQTVYRPWGSYTILEESDHYKIKRIIVNPRSKLSLQTHQHRSEHWVIVSGIATIINNGNSYILRENESTYIPATHQHRLSNDTEKQLIIIEVQCGNYVGEDDIVRFDDYYGRESNG